MGLWIIIPVEQDTGITNLGEILPMTFIKKNFFFKLPKPFFFFHTFIFIYLFLSVLGLCCSMWDLVPLPRIEPVPPTLGALNLSYWTTRDVPAHDF